MRSSLFSQDSGLDRHIRQRIFAEQVRELHNQRLTTVPSSILTALVTAGLMHGQADTLAIVQWLAIMLVTQFVTIGSVVAYRRAAVPDAGAARWARVQSLNTALTGSAWGSLVWFVWPQDESYRVLLLLLLSGVSAVAVVGVASLRRAVLGLLAPIWGLVLLRLVPEKAPVYHALGMLSALFCVVMMATAYRVHLILRDSIRLRCVNLDLIADLHVQKNRAQAADRAKTGFLAAASHDLRQPVHALSLLLRALETLVQSATPDWQQVGRVVGQSRQALQGLSHLLAALLDISKLDAGVVEIRPEPLNLQAVFEQLRGEFEPDAERRGLSLRFHATPWMALSDAVALKRILSNLIGNALRYTPHGGVLVGARRRNGKLHIEVWDTGVGIPATALESIFEEFVQLGNSERNREQGLGLGLAIVRRLAESQGQRVEVRSRVGLGSVFRLVLPEALTTGPGALRRLPVTRRKRTLPGQPTFDIPTMPPKLALSAYTLLLVDDDPDVLGATVALAESNGLRMLTAQTLAEALDHPSLPKVDVLLVDHRLPGGVTGQDVIQALTTRLQRTLPAILITGDTAPQRLREATASGLMLLHKPLEPDTLLRALNRCLQSVDQAQAEHSRQAS